MWRNALIPPAHVLFREQSGDCIRLWGILVLSFSDCRSFGKRKINCFSSSSPRGSRFFVSERPRIVATCTGFQMGVQMITVVEVRSW